MALVCFALVGSTYGLFILLKPIYWQLHAGFVHRRDLQMQPTGDNSFSTCSSSSLRFRSCKTLLLQAQMLQAG